MAVLEHTHPVVQSSALDYLKIDNKSKADIDLKHERGEEAEEESHSVLKINRKIMIRD